MNPFPPLRDGGATRLDGEWLPIGVGQCIMES